MSHVDLHDTMPGHWKTAALALGFDWETLPKETIRFLCAMGAVTTISASAIQYKPGGVMSNDLPAIFCKIPKDLQKAFVAALIEAGWLDVYDDSTVEIHDWEDVTKGYRKARADAEREKERRHRLKGEAEAKPVKEEQPNPDRSSTPAALLADQYMRVNKNLCRRDKVVDEIESAFRYGADPKEIERLVHDEASSKGVKIWDLLKPITPKMPNGKKEPTAEELVKFFQQKDAKLKKEEAPS